MTEQAEQRTIEQEAKKADHESQAGHDGSEASAHVTHNQSFPEEVDSEESAGKQPRPGREKRKNWLKRLWPHLWGKVLLILAGSIVLAVVLAAIPLTRYALLGQVVKKNVTLTVTDATTHQPVSQASVELDGKTILTDAQGHVDFKQIPVGNYSAVVTKKYYKNGQASILVPVLSQPRLATISLQATGRQVPVVIINSITHQPVQKATLTAMGTSVLTDNKGEAVIVLPADKQTVSGTISLNGYNLASVNVQVTSQKVNQNTFSLTPSGHIYFLSNRTGTINVMEANLDGGNPTVVVQGTSFEDPHSTVLLASRDWKYLILKAIRDNGGAARLYFIDASNNQMSIMDQGNGASFDVVGWSGDNFIYEVNRPKAIQGQYDQIALKSFNASTGSIATIDQTDVQTLYSGPIQSSISTPAIVGDGIIYTKFWNPVDYRLSATVLTGRMQEIVKASSDGSSQQVIKTFDATVYTNIETRVTGPNEVYYELFTPSSGWNTFYEYDDGNFKSVAIANDTSFYNIAYSTYLSSPSGQKTFWSESRDGQNALLIGDGDGQSATEVGTLSDYVPYGWFTDKYILIEKNGSELYIAPASGPITDQNLIKLTDYYKPPIDFNGYGYGYGGQ